MLEVWKCAAVESLEPLHVVDIAPGAWADERPRSGLPQDELDLGRTVDVDDRDHHDAEQHRSLEGEGPFKPVRYLDRDGVARSQTERVKRAGESEALAVHLRDIGGARSRVGVEDEERFAVLRRAVAHLVGEGARLVASFVVITLLLRAEFLAPAHITRLRYPS